MYLFIRWHGIQKTKCFSIYKDGIVKFGDEVTFEFELEHLSLNI